MTSACPVRPLHTSSYVGLGVSPPAYPTAVTTTPGVSQNLRSAPQKQPIPNTACSVPSGKGGCSGRPFTAWCSGTGIDSSRPGRASAAVGMLVLCRPNTVSPLDRTLNTSDPAYVPAL